MYLTISMRSLTGWLAVALALAFSFGANARAAVIAHDTVQPLSAAAQEYLFKFQPELKVEDGCVPFPAVDADGNSSGGLRPSGARNGDCASSVGQVYVRAHHYDSLCAVMYAWYFPKDQVRDGHRHDWENVVVWLSACSETANIVAVSYSAHGGYTSTTSPPLDGFHSKVKYYTNGITHHQLGSTDSEGTEQPLIHWEKLPDVARDALIDTDFGAGNVPMKDSNFFKNIEKAYFK
ncbi:necrosis-inducing protein [Altericroceibacterium spongiae]|uniref:Necrosis-inducing protein n=1 Tax=Altericroceibacterium spongiae TaxID=2320269 RepID=A0A420EKH9_9SPHN|nr:NPP1 family protein [Altericroceibacterium spongiae]RKF21160.1 necrosis-inducing protein [Altericroceibacterium spongiae]